MRLTRLGWGAVLLLVLTMMAAFSTGNNLLYVLYGASLSTLILSAVAGRLNLKRVSATAVFPDQVFAGELCRVALVLRNSGAWPVLALSAAGEWVECVDAGAEARVEARCRLEHRGLNELSGVFLESSYPFGLIIHRRPLGGLVGLALPRLREMRSAAETLAQASFSGTPLRRKGSGEEVYGIRDYDPSDDSRRINWKLSARLGRPLVVETCAPGEAKVTVRLAALGEGPAAERLVSEAASAFKFHIDTGAEVRLVTWEESLDYGKGILHLDRAMRLLARLGEGGRPRPSQGPGAGRPPITDTPALRRLTFVGIGLVMVSLYLIEEIKPALLTRLLPIVPLGWILHERGWPRLPRWVSEALSAALLAFVLGVDWRAAGVVIANTHLILYLLANRAVCEIKTSELPQVFIILFLGFFLVSGLTISPWYFLAFLGYGVFAAAWLALAMGLGPASARRWAPVYAVLTLASLGLTAAAFAMTPRVERLHRLNPFIAMGLDKLQPKTSSVVGFTERVSLGFYGELKRSTARFMRVRPLGSLAPGAKPPPLHIRGAAFDTFDGRVWSKSRADFAVRVDGKTYPTTGGRAWSRRRGEQLFFPAEPPERPVGLEFNLYPVTLSVLFTVGGLWAVEGPAEAAYFDHTDSVYFAAPYTGGTRYRLFSREEGLGFGGRVTGYDRLVREKFLQLPASLDPRVGELAERLTRDAAGAEAKARAVERHLRRSYRYSTYSDTGRNTLEQFLFVGRRGNCEYFATAAVVLLRRAGVPARLVTGFFADEWNEFGRFYDVRQGQAHAWAEAYADGRWITLEPTPPAAWGQAADALTKRLERYWNALQVNWYRHVIGYDHFVQRNTFFRLSRALSREALAARLKRLAQAVFYPLSAAAAACAFLLLCRRLRRRRQRNLFERVEDLLAGRGFSRRPDQTPREFVREVLVRRADLATLDELAEIHYRDRYSGCGLSPEDRRAAQSFLEDLAVRLRQGTGVSAKR